MTTELLRLKETDTGCLVLLCLVRLGGQLKIIIISKSIKYHKFSFMLITYFTEKYQRFYVESWKKFKMQKLKETLITGNAHFSST